MNKSCSAVVYISWPTTFKFPSKAFFLVRNFIASCLNWKIVGILKANWNIDAILKASWKVIIILRTSWKVYAILKISWKIARLKASWKIDAILKASWKIDTILKASWKLMLHYIKNRLKKFQKLSAEDSPSELKPFQMIGFYRVFLQVFFYSFFYKFFTKKKFT